MKRLVLAWFLLLAVSPTAFATTWVDIDVTCPVCQTVNVFQVPASFGTYVYYTPSRFQYVFWPATTDKFLYTCRECHLTTYMQDFTAIPEKDVPALAAMLEREAIIEGDVTPYDRIPVMVRLGIASKVYSLLGRDDAFWSEFHRIEGFHLAEAGRASDAHAARERALELTEQILIADTPDTRKESLVIAAALRFLTGDIPGSKTALAEALNL